MLPRLASNRMTSGAIETSRRATRCPRSLIYLIEKGVSILAPIGAYTLLNDTWPKDRLFPLRFSARFVAVSASANCYWGPASLYLMADGIPERIALLQRLFTYRQGFSPTGIIVLAQFGNHLQSKVPVLIPI